MGHYIAMFGFSGYIPSMCEVYQKKEEALESLEYGCTLTEVQYIDLDNYNFINLDPSYGGDYCEIQFCDCKTPWIHGEDMDEMQWKDLYGEEETNDHS